MNERDLFKIILFFAILVFALLFIIFNQKLQNDATNKSSKAFTDKNNFSDYEEILDNHAIKPNIFCMILTIPKNFKKKVKNRELKLLL